MRRTLFFYIFKDLLRIFLLTAGGLAGIMSFGGLLRPLTEHGLDAGQVMQILAYFMPAMMTYSLPIAALFATTVVYGRLAADNEITACRAAGISFLSISTPSIVLGLTVAIISLLFLCFVVPVFSLKVEAVVYENLAKLVAGEIERTRQIRWSDQTIYAKEAAVAPVNPDRPDEQVVTLGQVMVVNYEEQPGRGRMQVPREFYLAKRATAVIWPDEQTDGYLVTIRLEGGNTVPREFAGAVQAGLTATQVGPFRVESPIQEETKFMDLRRLHELYQDRTRSRHVQRVLTELIRAEQGAAMMREVMADLAGPTGRYRLDAGREVYEIRRGAEAPVVRGSDLVLSGGDAELIEERDGRVHQIARAAEIRLSFRPVRDDTMAVTIKVHNPTRYIGNEEIRAAGFQLTPTVAMPAAVRRIADHPPEYFLTGKNLPEGAQNELRRTLIRLGNGIHSELHARASFAVSCLILVMVGGALGMMFKSGNFLNAFAISVAPALLCIALIVTGQHMTENIPRSGLENFPNHQLDIGLALIWSGNVAVLILAGVLMWRLQRQ